MKEPSGKADAGTGVPRGRPHRVALWGLVAWTAVVVPVVWWLLGTVTQPADLLIPANPLVEASWFSHVRAWVAAHVEVYWAYPWVLLAPYVVWCGLRITLERHGLAWRLVLHVLLGTGFVIASQTLTGRMETRRPRAWVVRQTGLVEHAVPGGTNTATNATLTWVTEDGRPPEPGLVDGFSGEDWPTNLTTPTFWLTNGVSGRAGTQHRVLVWRIEDGVAENQPRSQPPGALDAAPTNPVAPFGFSALRVQEEVKFVSRRAPWAPPLVLAAALDGFAYVALVGLAQAIQFRRRLNARERQASRLEAQLTQSRLHALQAQLQPHFLFNALNGIATLVRRDPRIAEDMLAALSDLLRVSLAQHGRQEILLREELDFLDRYLELQQMRFGARLRIERHVDPETLDCRVPSLLLQPLVENAIRHGIEPNPESGLVRLTATREAGRVTLTVEDDGGGPESLRVDATSVGGGIGLRSVRERLAGLYGSRHEFALEPRPGGGTTVRVVLPDRRAEPALAPDPPDTP